VTDRGLLLTTPLGVERLCCICIIIWAGAPATCEKPLEIPTTGVVVGYFGVGSIERLWDVGIPALRTSVAEVLRIRSVLFQISPVD